MSSSRRQWAPFEDIRLPLCCRAVVIDNGQSRIGLVALDLLGLAGEAVGGMDGFKQRIATHSRNTLRPEQFILTSTHTHSGPETLALTDLDRTEPFRKWVERLAQHVGAALQDASERLHPVDPRVGMVTAPGLSVNRRVLTSRGIAVAGSARASEPGAAPEGPTDDQVRTLVWQEATGRVKAVLVGATAHPVYEMCLKRISPDYPGEMSQALENRHQDATALMFQGAAGNINSPTVSTGAGDARRHGRRLADLVDQAIQGSQPLAGHQLSLRWDTVALPARTATGQPQPTPLTVRLAAARIGSAAFVFLPGEPFVEIALAIQKASPFSFTSVVGYAEDYCGYIPTDRAFDNGGYETRPGRWSRVTKGSEPLVVERAIALLATLADNKLHKGGTS